MSDTVVFLGPTLSREEAAALFQADYAGPAEQGFVYDAACRPNLRRIVLIDGAFGQVPSVRHKELLWAMSRGIELHGAASLGAMRAAELAEFGMIGHGLIYRWFRAIPLLDDQEVAVAMAPAELGSCALSVALVDMRLTLRWAERRGAISRPLRHFLEWTAQEMEFQERRYSLLAEQARSHLPSAQRFELDTLLLWITEHQIQQKRADAINCLQHLAANPNLPPDPVEYSWSFPMTESWLDDLQSSGRLLPEV